MSKRNGQEIFEQYLARLYSEKAPTLYAFSPYYGLLEQHVPRLHSTLALLSRKYRKVFIAADQETIHRIGSHENLSAEAFLMTAEHADGIRPAEVCSTLDAMRRGGGFYNDKDMLAFTTGRAFYNNETPYRVTVASYDEINNLRKKAADMPWRVDLVPIININPTDSTNMELNTTNSIVFSYFDRNLVITLFGANDDEVFSFVDKSGQLEPFPNDMLCSYDSVLRAKTQRITFFTVDDTSDVMCNIFAAFEPEYTFEDHCTTAVYKEVFTLVNAATIPLGEAIRLAIPIEHSIDIAAATPHKRTIAELAEEAIAAWIAGEYITCQDVTQPGLSRTGSIVYISKLLGEVIVLSFNLKLSKEKNNEQNR